MSLTRCPECGGSIASDADQCPSCGSKSIAKLISRKRLKWKVLVLAFAVIFGLVAMFIAWPARGFFPKNELPKGPNPSRSIQ
jgi:predicted nucleic acid-binding Zn ribbon protein